MIKEILIICNRSDIVSLIRTAIGDRVGVSSAMSVLAALKSFSRPFDLVFMDLGPIHEDVAQAVQDVIAHFTSANPLTQLIALAPIEGVLKAVEAVKHGASYYLTYPFDGSEIRLSLEIAGQTLIKDLELEYLRDKFWKSDWKAVIRTSNTGMSEVFETVRNVAPTIATVLLRGETGTGKGLMARLIHRHSHRSEGPFVAVHCGAIPETLIESELFGHEKGAFTGADRRRVGKFEMACAGTIFLDEIGTISAAAQIKLLQVLQDGTFSRVGAEGQLQTDARIIAATNADLEKMADEGAFRRDLFYRLNIFPIEIPPLRDRLEDLPHLVDLFLTNLNRKYGKNIKGLHPDIKTRLGRYTWPGNLRELENVLERAYILEDGDVLMPSRFPVAIMAAPSRMPQSPGDWNDLPLSQARQMAVDQFEGRYLIHLLKHHRGRISSAAEAAGITPRQLSRLLSRHGLDKRDYRS